ncbi:MAG: hypothetical protein ABJE10_02510 [bacterium]
MSEAHPTTFRASGRARLYAAAILLSVFGASCSRATEQSDPGDVGFRADSTITVRIVNRSQIDAVIFIVHDGVRDRLGAVTAAGTSSFAVRTRTIPGGEFSLLADPVGSRQTTTSERLHLALGTVFTWTLETDFSRGAVMVQ